MYNKKRKSNFSVLMEYAGGHKYFTFFSLLLSAISGIIALFPFVFIWLIIKEAVQAAPDFSSATDMVKNGWFAVGFALLYVVIYLGALMCSHKSAFRVARNIREKLLNHLSALPIGEIGDFGSGRLRQITLQSSSAAETFLAHELPDMMQAIVTPLMMLVMLFIFDWRLGLVSLAPAVIGFALMFSMAGPKMKTDMKNYKDALEEMNNEAVEYVRGIPVVKAFNRSVFSFKRFSSSIEKYGKFCISYTKKCRKSMVLYMTVINSVACVLSAFAMIMNGVGLADESFIINLLFYIIFTPVIATSLTRVMFISESNMVVGDAIERIDSVLCTEPLKEAENPETPVGFDIEFDGVTFRYKNCAANALEEASFNVPEKSFVALVGPSGGGKSTMANLLARFYDVSGGSIKIGGVNVKNISTEKLREKISYVFQDSKIFKGTIAENVRLADPSADDERVKEALDRAQCADIIAKFKDGVNTVLGVKGTYLSGGEIQRIAIARCFLKKSQIVILDEATAYADPENEILVQKAFSLLAKDKTVIMIAHRLSAVRNADKILVIKDGKIAEEGSHDALLKQRGVYEKMWNDYQKSAAWKVGR